MKAKKLIRLSLFAALLCMITILGAFAAETDAKIYRFDGMGTLPAGIYNIDKYAHSITSDGILRIELKKSDLGSYTDGKFSASTIQPYFNFNTYGAELNFNLSEYSYAKIKYRTNYTGKMQFYLVVPGTGNGHIFFEQGNVGSTTAWQTKELHYDSTDSSYNGNKLNLTEETGYFPTAEKDIPVGNSNKPFFQFKGISEADYNKFSDTDIIYVEIEYVAFFKTSEDMNAYTGNDNTEHAKILAWDGSQNVRFTTPTSQTSGTETFYPFSITEDGNFRIDMTAENMNNPKLHENAYDSTAKDYNYAKSNGSTCFSPIFTIQDSFNLYDYPYLKIKFKHNYPKTSQYFTAGTKYYTRFGGTYADGSEHILGVVHPTDGSKDNPESDSLKYFGGTWNLSQNNAAYPSETSKGAFTQTRFQFKGVMTDTDKDGIADAPVSQDYFAEIYYIAYFDSEEAMLAYDSDESNVVDKAVETILNAGAATEFQLTVHPGVTEEYVAEYVATKAQGMVEDVTVTAEFNTAYKYYYNVLVTVKSGDISKTIGINVRIKGTLADITPTVKGAQTRTDGAFGLRFGFTYNDKTDLTGYDEDPVSYGALLIAKDLLGDKELTIEVGTVDVDYRDVPCKVLHETNETTGEVTYTAVVTNIPNEDANTTVIVARPYVKYKVGGKEYIAYGKQISRSVNQIKDMINEWSTDAE